MSHDVSTFILLYVRGSWGTDRCLDINDTKTRIVHIADILAKENDNENSGIGDASISQELCSSEGNYVVIANGQNWPRIDFRLFAERLAEEFRTKVISIISDEEIPYDDDTPCETRVYCGGKTGQLPGFKSIMRWNSSVICMDIV